MKAEKISLEDFRADQLLSHIKKLENEINLLKQEFFVQFRQISDEVAEKEIINLLKNYKRKGTNRISVISIVMELNLPAEQVEKIISKFEDKELVKEVEL